VLCCMVWWGPWAGLTILLGLGFPTHQMGRAKLVNMGDGNCPLTYQAFAQHLLCSRHRAVMGSPVTTAGEGHQVG
jgi:hypothetical protein